VVNWGKAPRVIAGQRRGRIWRGADIFFFISFLARLDKALAWQIKAGQDEEKYSLFRFWLGWAGHGPARLGCARFGRAWKLLF
jgi:hypothetical protein